MTERFTTTVDEERRLLAFQAVGLINLPPDSRLLAAQAVALEMSAWAKEGVPQQMTQEALFSACAASDSAETAILNARRTISFLQTGEVDCDGNGRSGLTGGADSAGYVTVRDLIRMGLVPGGCKGARLDPLADVLPVAPSTVETPATDVCPGSLKCLRACALEILRALAAVTRGERK